MCGLSAPSRDSCHLATPTVTNLETGEVAARVAPHTVEDIAMGTPAARRRCPYPLLPPLVEEVVGKGPPWLVPDDLWGRVEPLLPARQQRLRKLGRPPLDDRGCLQGSCSCCTRGSSGSGCRRSSASALLEKRYRTALRLLPSCYRAELEEGRPPSRPAGAARAPLRTAPERHRGRGATGNSSRYRAGAPLNQALNQAAGPVANAAGAHTRRRGHSPTSCAGPPRRITGRHRPPQVIEAESGSVSSFVRKGGRRGCGRGPA